MISLYVHIPFCKQKCSYCSFYSLTNADKNEYVSALLRYIEHYGKNIKKTVGTLYFGGGTPSLLSPKQLENIITAIKTHFTLAPNAEITLEGNPDSLSKEFLQAVKKLGVNRLSIGVQSFIDSELKAISRVHDSKTAIAAIHTAKNCGFDNISCDFIFGLPHQTKESLLYSLDTAIDLGIPHISCYNLQLESGTPLFESGVKVPDEQEQEAMYYAACERLSEAGYLHYEISNFSKPSMHSRHNSAYWDGTEYLGLGPAAHSMLGGVRYGFDADIFKFINKEDFEFDISETIDDPLFEKIMLGLRTSRGVPLDNFKRSSNYIKRLCDGGFCVVTDGVLRLTDSGFYLSNTIISDITAKEC